MGGPMTRLILTAAFATLLGVGCLLDSVEPWLSPATIVETEIDVDGTWSVVDEVEFFGGGAKRVITLERKPATERAKEFFYVTIHPKPRDTQFVFRATLHEIEGLRFLQVFNFSHYDGDTFALANRPTYSLWRIEADEDNVLIWMPELPRGVLETIRDQDDKALFVDQAANNEAAIRAWARADRAATEKPRRALGLGLTRAGTAFVMPASVESHLPEVYTSFHRNRQKGKADPSS